MSNYLSWSKTLYVYYPNENGIDKLPDDIEIVNTNEDNTAKGLIELDYFGNPMERLLFIKEPCLKK